MDISRPDLRKKRIRRNVVLYLGIALAVGIGVSFILRLKPAIPAVDSAVWTDTVKSGPLLIQVRGPGELAPREDGIRLIPAETEATVIRIRVLPGTHVEPDTVFMDLVDPELQQQLLDAGVPSAAVIRCIRADLPIPERPIRHAMVAAMPGSLRVVRSI
jgi:multidrug efflux pump subunit AcrA (membrane-fusion protein)